MIVLLSLVTQLQISLAFVQIPGLNVYVKESQSGPIVGVVGQSPLINVDDEIKDTRRKGFSPLGVPVKAKKPRPVTRPQQRVTGDAF